MLIAIDQENGGVNSLYDEALIRQFPSAMGVAATGSKKLAREIAKASALELSACGINWIMGPVLDVLTNSRNQPLGARSFGDDPQEVSAYGIECMKGLREGGLATCGKHFPSYGNLEFFGAPTDVPTITESLEQLSQSALVPFRNAIAQGIDAMMVGGVAMASSNMNVMHACLSEQIIQDLLRRDLQFDGVVVSECLEMEALSRNIGIGGGAVMAFKAGCDVILTCRSLTVQEEAIHGLRSGLENGMIEKDRIRESFQRVLELKMKYTSWETAFAPPGLEKLMRLQTPHTNLATAAYNKSITVVRDQKQYLPLGRIAHPGDNVLLLTPLLRPLPASAAARQLADRTNMPSPDTFGNLDNMAVLTSGESVFYDFGKALARRSNLMVYHTSYTQNGLRPVHETLISQSRAVIVVTADAGRNMYQMSFAKYASMLCKMNMDYDGQLHEKPCIVIAVSSPYDFLNDATIGTYVCTYDFTEAALQTLVRVLVGHLNPTGTLPSGSAQTHKSSQTRQQWFVENFDESRDSKALSTLLGLARRERSTNTALLNGTTASSFLLKSPEVDEAHFVVRNSSTKELFGFCATYYHRSTGKGYIGGIIVQPERRKLSIGYSLHNRAIRVLKKQPGITSIGLGTRLPGIYLGIPKSDANAYLRMSKWFAKLGWDVSQSRSVCSMILTNLSTWSAPSGLGQALANAEIKFDLVHGSEYSDAVMEHVKTHPVDSVTEIYRIAIPYPQGCGIIRAKRASDSFIQGTVIMTFSTEARLGKLLPMINTTQAGMGGILAPVISPSVGDSSALIQGLVLLGVRQLKRQGLNAVFLDCVSFLLLRLGWSNLMRMQVDEGPVMKSLQSLGFEVHQRFDEIVTPSSTWHSPTAS